jgi:hypothetical protein
MMRKNNNRNNMKHRGGQGGGRRYHQGGGGGNRGQNDGQNIARQKHHAMQQREKYSNMARDAQNNGDRVDVEYYLQHVDHYTRVLADIAVIEAERYAHHREQQIAQGTAEGGQTDGAAGESTDANAATSESGNTDDAAPITPSHQPRMTRHPRRQYQANPSTAENTSGEANNESSGDDIPLPGGILPQL